MIIELAVGMSGLFTLVYALAHIWNAGDWKDLVAGANLAVIGAVAALRAVGAL